MMVQKTQPTRTISLIALITGATAISLLTVPYYLFPQFFTPKANAVMGYTSPATTEGWIIMTAGLLLLGTAIVLAGWLKKKKKA